MPRRPTIEDLQTAAEWLDINEGEDGEAVSCHAVADWLRREAARRQTAQVVTTVARETGRSRAIVRKAIKNWTAARSTP